MNVLILFSGGVDSTALIPYYLDLGFKVKLLWIDYGQTSKRMEETAVNKISDYYNVELMKVRTNMQKHNKVGYEYVGRNLFLISVATMVFPFDYGLISSGIRLNSNYKDCTLFFAKLAKQIVEFLSEGTISLDLPLLLSSKREVIEFCLEKRVPLDLTYSCDNGGDKPCGHCPSCNELREAYEGVKNNAGFSKVD